MYTGIFKIGNDNFILHSDNILAASYSAPPTLHPVAWYVY